MKHESGKTFLIGILY